MVSNGAAYKISNVSIKEFKLTSPTMSSIDASSTIVDDAFKSAVLGVGDVHIIDIKGFNVVYSVINNQIQKSIAFDNQGNCYKSANEGTTNCTICTTYANKAICEQFNALSAKLSSVNQPLITKLCKDKFNPMLPALQESNAQTVLNYFNAPLRRICNPAEQYKSFEFVIQDV